MLKPPRKGGEASRLEQASKTDESVSSRVWIPCIRSFACHAAPVISIETCLRAIESTTPARMPRKIRIACVGDSITYGNGSHAKRKLYHGEGNYPLDLQAFFRQHVMASFPAIDVEVRNFGKGGTTAANHPRSMSYRRSTEFQQSKLFLPHVVILMLGTNDSKPRSWFSVEHFIEALEYFNSAYRVLSTKPVVIVMAPPPSLSALGKINGSRVRDEIVPAIIGLPSKSPDRWFASIDLFEPFHARVRDPLSGLTAAPESWPKRYRSDRAPFNADLKAREPYGAAWLHDGVHPTLHGHALIAQLVAATLCGDTAATV